MNIVLDEREWTETAIKNRQIGSSPMDTLRHVAQYYYECGYKKKDIREKLDDFLIQCDPSVVLVKWSDSLDKLTKAVGRYPLIKVDSVDVTETELNTIAKIEGVQMRRLAFTLLCIAKYWDIARMDNNHWTNSKDRDIMKMANINTSIRRQSKMLHDLRELGLIKFSKRVDNLNIQIQYIDTVGDAVLHIVDFRNLGNQYLLYFGEPYFQCEQCGVTIKKKKNVHRYCVECASEMHVKKSVESVMRQRVFTS